MRVQCRPLTEKDFLAMVRRLATLNGWLCYHAHDSRRSPAGFPDLLLLHPEMGAALAAELKTDTGRLTPDQERWLTAFRKCGIGGGLWRPRDFDLIELALRREA